MTNRDALSQILERLAHELHHIGADQSEPFRWVELTLFEEYRAVYRTEVFWEEVTSFLNEFADWSTEAKEFFLEKITGETRNFQIR